VNERIIREKKECEYRSLLRKKNIALKEVLDQIELEKREVEKSVVENIDKLVLPLIHELEIRTGNNREIFKLIRKNLSKITSSYGRQISMRCAQLSQRELEICTLVKSGLSNKEIAKSLRLSLLTVEKHRHRIRKKLGITHEKVNLASFLQSL
jgi:DNA-binding NarL/FixJ family response regulator